MRWYEPIPISRYPHLGKNEVSIFNAFLNANDFDIDRMAFDIPVGNTSKPPPGTPENIIRDWNYLCAYKIDALLILDASVLICEIKPHANPATFGQLEIYSTLFKYKYPGFPNIEKLCICNICPEVIKPFFIENNILIHENFKHSPLNPISPSDPNGLSP